MDDPLLTMNKGTNFLNVVGMYFDDATITDRTIVLVGGTFADDVAKALKANEYHNAVFRQYLEKDDSLASRQKIAEEILLPPGKEEETLLSPLEPVVIFLTGGNTSMMIRHDKKFWIAKVVKFTSLTKDVLSFDQAEDFFRDMIWDGGAAGRRHHLRGIVGIAYTGMPKKV